MHYRKSCQYNVSSKQKFGFDFYSHYGLEHLLNYNFDNFNLSMLMMHEMNVYAKR
jgi:hypothetical protein